ncbi:MAG: efflux RND transporter permease subunit [Microscillaceae bacterium]
MTKKANDLVVKNFPLTTLAVDNRTSVLILSLILTVFGIISYVAMPKESYPEVVIPQVYVGTAYPGNSPVDMENLITRPIEKELKSVSNVKKINSTSIQDYSTIIVEFNTGVDINRALQDVKDGVDQAKGELPNDLDQDPQVFEVKFSEIPIMIVNLSGDFKLHELKAYAEYLQDEIEKLSEISYAEIRGAPEREIRIDADLFKMEAMKVSFGDIAQAIQTENVTISGGNIKAGETRRSIRVVGEFKTVEEIGNVIVKSEEGNDVYLRDVATVNDTEKEAESYARSRKLPVVSLNVVKRQGKNILDASDKIKAILKDAQKNRFPKGLEIALTNDQSRQIRYMVSNLENSIISGVILVVLVLLFFMGLRSALFVGIAIPLSMFISFIILSVMGVSMNMMVLFSLILALGMLVDNGIVVIENIYRLMEEGVPIKQAIKEGVGEIAVPIIASTATTVAAFLPLAFWDGIMGDFMKYLPITLIVTLSASLFVALVINPAIAVVFARLEKGNEPVSRRTLIIAIALVLFSVPFYITGSNTLANLLMVTGVFILLNAYVLSPAAYWFQKKGLTALESSYWRLITFSLTGTRPYYLFGGTLALLIISFMLVGTVGLKVLFFPNNEPAYINVFVQKPVGTDIEETNALTKKLEDRIIKLMQPYDYMIDAIIAQVGEGTTDPNEGPQQGVTPNRAKITVSFKEFEYRKGQNTSELLEIIREEVKQYAGVQITADKDAAGPPLGAPINIEVIGEDYDKLISLAEKLEKYLEDANIPGIEELKSDLESGKPELLVDVDREKARSLGLSSATVAQELRTALFGLEVSKFKDGEDDHPIQLRLRDEQRYDLEALRNKPIVLNDRGNYYQIPIASVADFNFTSTYGAIKRKDLDRVISISSNVKEGYNANEIIIQLKKLVEAFGIPDGFQVKFTGEQEEQQESSDFLMRAFLLALFMVFLIIVTQFNSLSAPLVIMCSVLFSTIGVFLGLVAFRMDFVILMTGIGIISLAGVVVNNAIVLIDYTNLLRLRRKADLGMDPDEHLPNDEFIKCIAEAGRTRLRPVLLTAITTGLGLLPLATGLNIDFITLLSEFDPKIYFGGDNVAFFGPMAWTVIFGLTFATFLTLVIVPVMYLLTDKLKVRPRVEKKEIKVRI